MPAFDEFHPLFVHFPIALFAAAWLSDTLGLILNRESLTTAGCWNLLFALISSVFTIATGFVSDSLVGHMEDPFPLFSTHGSLQIFAVFWLGLTALLRWRFFKRIISSKTITYLYIAVFSVGILFLFYGAHLGAKLANRI